MSYRISMLGWSELELQILCRFVDIAGQVQRNKPATDDPIGKCAAYVWRMIQFHISKDPRHQCMPVMCYYELPGDYRAQNVLAKELDKLVDRVLKHIPCHQWHGIMKWKGLV